MNYTPMQKGIWRRGFVFGYMTGFTIACIITVLALGF